MVMGIGFSIFLAVLDRYFSCNDSPMLIIQGIFFVHIYIVSFIVMDRVSPYLVCSKCRPPIIIIEGNSGSEHNWIERDKNHRINLYARSMQTPMER